MEGKRNPMVALARGYQLQRAFAKIGKARRKAKERAERSPELWTGLPMAASARMLAYANQRDGGGMTPAQRRRYNRKLVRDMVRHAVDEA